MLLRIAALALAVPLLACSEAETCRQNALAPLSRLDSQIRTTEENVARGYELIEVRRDVAPRQICRPVRVRPPVPPAPPATRAPGPHFGDRLAADAEEAALRVAPPETLSETPAVRLATAGGHREIRCRPAPEPEPRYLRRAINVEAERAKLASLRAQRARLVPQVEARLAQCPAG